MNIANQSHHIAMLARHRELKATRRDSLNASDCVGCPDATASPSTRVVAGISTEPQLTDAELAAERRYAELHRCRHRSVDSIRTEPCACPSVSELPIYRCDLLDCDCSDLRRPQTPAKFCGGCKSRD